MRVASLQLQDGKFESSLSTKTLKFYSSTSEKIMHSLNFEYVYNLFSFNDIAHSLDFLEWTVKFFQDWAYIWFFHNYAYITLLQVR